MIAIPECVLGKLRVITLVAGLLTVCTAMGQSGLKFSNLSWEEAMQTAQKQHKLLFVEGYATWSEPCTILEEYTFTDEEVGAFFNEHFICLQVDMDNYPGSELADYYAVNAFPVLLFIDGDGELRHQGCGALDAKALLTLGKNALGDLSLSQLEKQFLDGERGQDFLIRLSKTMEQACLDRSTLVNLYFENLPQEQWISPAAWAVISLNVTDPYCEPFQYLMSHQQEFATQFGQDTVAHTIYNVLLDQLVSIYEGADLTLFATQALKQLALTTSLPNKSELIALSDLKIANINQDWSTYGKSVIQVVKDQQVTDPEHLNEFSWNFYLYVDNEPYLKQAKAWMAEVIQKYTDASYYDTYASLLFKLGDQKGAVKYENLAMDQAQKQAEDLTHYKEQLQRFQAGN